MSDDPFDRLEPLYTPASPPQPGIQVPRLASPTLAAPPPAPKRPKVDWDVPKLLRAMPGVIGQAEDQWVIDFARSMMRHAKRPGWKPTTKQEFIMRQLVGETVLYPADDRQGDLFTGFNDQGSEVIEH